MDKNSFNIDQHLTYEELVEYQRGNLGNSEMHRLELHLIDCDLCNEALDGLANIEESDLLKHMANIRSRTEIKAEGGGITKKHWYAIAASIALIAVLSVFLLVPSADKTTIIAEKLPATEKKADSVIEPAGKTDLSADTIIADKPFKEAILADAAAPPTVNQDNIEEGNTEELTSDTPEEISNEVSLAATDEALLVESEIAMEDTAEQALADVTTLAENQGDDQKNIARSKKVADPTAGAEITTLQKAEAVESNQTEVIEYKDAKPVRGRRSFERYLKRRLNYPDAARENNIEGEVILELTINADGNIADIVVLQSLGYGCDQEAMRLVREGPAWLPGTANGTPINSSVQVNVPFKL
jgi:TonB family protein